MAINICLHIDGGEGDATHSTRHGWIAAMAAQFGVWQPHSAMASTGWTNKIA